MKINTLLEIKEKVYDKCSLEITGLYHETEGTKYDACQFQINGKRIICRSSKITPKKTGQFVTFWKRDSDGITEPYSQNDDIDYYVINSRTEEHLGQFVIPTEVLINKGIIRTNKKEGKRGFRVYTKWDKPQSKQAIKTQEWQLDYFYQITDKTDYNRVKELYSMV